MPDFFGIGNLLKRLVKPGENARTPGFVPERVGKDIGGKFGGTLPNTAPDLRIEAIKPSPVMPSGSNRPSAPFLIRLENIGGETPAPRSALDDPISIQQPRMAARTMKEELAIRREDPNAEVVFRSPMERAKYDYLTREGGDPTTRHKGWRAGFGDFFRGGQTAVRQLPPGSDVGTVIGTFLGGGGGAAAQGKFDPVGLEETEFEYNQAPRMYRDMAIQNEQATQHAKLQREQQQMEIARRNQQLDEDRFAFEKQRNKFGAPQMVVGEDGQEHLVVFDTNDPTKRIDLGIAGTPHAQRELAKYNREQQKIIAEMNNTARATENEKNRTSRENIAKSNQAINLYKHDNPNRSEGNSATRERQATTIASRWAEARKRALDNSLTADERQNAFNEMNAHADTLKNNYSDLYETEGTGGWSYVQRRKAGGQSATQPQGDFDLEGYIKAAEAKGKTREQAMQYLRGKGIIK